MKTLFPLATLLLLCACVTQSEHDAAMAQAAQRLHLAQQQAAQEIGARESKIQTMQAALAQLQVEIEQRDHRISDATAQIAGLQAKLDDATALNQAMGRELEKAGKSVDALATERGSLKQALEETKQRLEELRKSQEAAQRRAELFKSLITKFKKQIDAGQLTVVLRDGRMVLRLRNDVLFDPGRTSIKKEGQQALRDVAGVLASIGRQSIGRKLQVAGHTDNLPIGTDRFPSNWELSTARAVGVVKFLVAEGVKPELLSASGYGEHDPVAPNDTDDNRAKNRRIEIVLQPDISELVQLPDAS